MLSENDKINGVLSAIRCYVPGFSLKLKSESWLQRAIGKTMSLIGNKDYMSCYWTLIGKTVYRPTACNQGPVDGEWRVILHEGRHVDDCYKLGLPLYSFLYFFPQIFGILGILYALALIPALLLGAPAVLLWGLLSLLCLAPIPALGRAVIEARAYLVSLCVDFWSGTMGDEEEYLGRLVGRFTDSGYYFMWPFRGMVKRYFERCLEGLKTGTIKLDSYLLMCRTKANFYK